MLNDFFVFFRLSSSTLVSTSNYDTISAYLHKFTRNKVRQSTPSDFDVYRTQYSTMATYKGEPRTRVPLGAQAMVVLVCLW